MFSPIVLPLVGVVLFGLHLTGITGYLNPGGRFLVVALVFVLWPGDILARHLFGFAPSNFPLRFLAALCAGTACFSLGAFVLTLFGAPFAFYDVAMKLLVFLLYLIYGVRTLRRSGVRSPVVFDAPLMTRYRVPILAAGGLLALWMFLSPGVIQPIGDTYDHIGYMRRIVSENDLSPTDVLAPAGGGPLRSDPRKGTLHPMLAFWSEATSIDPAALWLYLPALFAPAALFAFLFFSTYLLPSGAYLLLAAVLFVLFQGGIGREFFSTIAYGQNLSMIFLWTIMGLTFARLNKAGASPLPFLLLLAAGAGFMHLGFMIQFALMIASLAIFRRYLGYDSSALWRLAGSVALLAAGLFAWKYLSAYGSVNVLHSHRQGLLSLGSGAYIASPIEILRRYSLVFMGGIVLLPGLFLVRRHSDAARACIVLSVLPVLICFNPLVAPAVYGTATYLLHRLVLNIPAFQAIALLMGVSIAWARRSRISARLAVLAGIFVWIGLFLTPGKGAVVEAFRSSSFGAGRSSIAGPFEEVIDRAGRIIPDGSVVLSDPLTSYALSAYRDVRVVSVLHQHGNPNDPLAMERLAASRDVLSPFVSQRESMRYLEKFSVNYIVINGAYDTPVHEFLADWSSVFFNPARNKFAGPRDNFSVVYASDRVVVVKVLGYFLREERWFPTIPYLDDDDLGMRECGNPIAGCGVRIRGIAVTPLETLPGERVRFRIQYERETHPGSGFPVRLIVRLDNKEYVSRFGSYPGSKSVRRMMERRGGFLSRYRIDRLLFNGFYPPELWPIGSPVTEEFEIKLPSSLKEGVYDVELKLVYDSLLPNFNVRDFLYNDDSYSGAACATIAVSKSLVR